MSQSSPAPLTLRQRCAPIEWLVLDVDGVLTEGAITYTSAGRTEPGGEVKSFHVRDGSALKRWHKAGRRSVILTGRSSPTVARRATELGVAHVVQGAADKGAVFPSLLAEIGAEAQAACCIGDDVPDVLLLQQAGLAVAPADAHPAARAAAQYITRAAGGRGAVAEVVGLLLGCQLGS